MDDPVKAGDEGVMDLSGDAGTLWNAAKALGASAVARGVPSVSLPPLLFMTDPDRTPAPWETAGHLPTGAGVVYRHFGAVDTETTARRLREVTRAAGVILLIGADADLAGSVGADGVHLPERDLVSAADLRRRRPDWLLTGAIHGDLAAVEAASGLDALILSPVFAAGGASADKLVLGVAAFADRVRRASLPVYALGGITAANARQLSDSGACGIAGVEALRKAFRPST